jgi:cell division protein FtsQ
LSNTANELKSDIKRRKRWRSLAINSLVGLVVVLIFTLMGFAGKKQSDAVCWKLEVSVLGNSEQKFIDEAYITRLAEAATDEIVGKKITDVDIAAIHKKLSENSSIKKAHVFTTVDGKCVIQVKQRTPIARIMNADGTSFYLAKDGFTMALSNHYTAKVPVFTGVLSEKMREKSILDYPADDAFLKATMLDDIYSLTKFISKNEFWKAQVEHIRVNARHEFEIIPRVGNHLISIGDISNLDEKFKKLMAFYANTIHTRDLNQYSSINVEYDGQVVCVKRAY